MIRSTRSAAAGEAAGGATAKALLFIRELILDGELAPGERIAEVAVAARAGVSRTPIRAALQRLEDEGLVELIPSGGFAAKTFTERDVSTAIEIRGTLEGLAARLAAERNPSPAEIEPLRACVEALDAVVPAQFGTEEGFVRYTDLNARLHELIVALADAPSLARQIGRAASLPFASPSGFVMAQSQLPESHRNLVVAQDQHRCVVDAIARREGTRAEAIMREHARLAGRNLQVVLRSEKAARMVPGGALLRSVLETSGG